MPSSRFKDSVFCRATSWIVSFLFLTTSICPPPLAHAQVQPNTVLNLPVPGTMVQTTSGYNPAIIRGLAINPDNPLQFDFIIDTGDDDLS